jgi:hypothetical protein
MTVTLRFSAEIESQLRAEAARKGVSLEEHLERLVERSLVHPAAASPMPAEGWERDWRAWAAGHKPLLSPADDDRGALYAGRGE